MLKKCNRCGEIKPIENFNKNKTTRDGYQGYCRICTAKYHREYRQRHPDRVKATQERWNRSEKAKESYRKYDAVHREQRREYHRRRQIVNRKAISAYRLNKLHTDPQYYFKQRVRQCIRDSVGRLGLKKSKKTEEIVGLSFDKFKEYLLETWEKNYGKPWNGEPYHIDHIVPLATAKTEEDILRLCHYTNLQMLTPHDNLTKSDSI